MQCPYRGRVCSCNGTDPSSELYGTVHHAGHYPPPDPAASVRWVSCLYRESSIADNTCLQASCAQSVTTMAPIKLVFVWLVSSRCSPCFTLPTNQQHNNICSHNRCVLYYSRVSRVSTLSSFCARINRRTWWQRQRVQKKKIAPLRA